MKYVPNNLNMVLTILLLTYSNILLFGDFLTYKNSINEAPNSASKQLKLKETQT